MKCWMMFVAVLLCAMPAAAANRCYSPDEVNAEQWLRLHSELMVITVTCHQSSTGQDLVAAYTGFTKSNITTLHDAEQTLTAYYKKAYGGQGVDRLDRLRTLLANEIGQQAANVSSPAFCAQRRDKVIALRNAGLPVLEGEVGRLRAAARTLEPACSDKVRTANKG